MWRRGHVAAAVVAQRCLALRDGGTHVCRGLLRISPSSRTTPTPILFADPSMPNAIRGLPAAISPVGAAKPGAFEDRSTRLVARDATYVADKGVKSAYPRGCKFAQKVYRSTGKGKASKGSSWTSLYLYRAKDVASTYFTSAVDKR